MLIVDHPGPAILLGLGFWNIAIPAAIAGISALMSKKQADKQADEKDKMCEAENKRRAAMGGAIAKAYGLDTNIPEVSALMAPRPCPDAGAGNTYGLLGDLFGGASLAVGSAMKPDSQQSPQYSGIPPNGGVPCPPGTVQTPSGCLNPSALFGEENQGTSYSPTNLNG